ncbi:MAG: hypothetical protein PVS3B3_07490 [Ktedonobacteraceae bacterium]
MDIKERTNETSAAPEKRPGDVRNANWQRSAILVAGDMIVFLIFAIIGRRSHSEAGTIFGPVITALPFATAWFLVAPFIGAFRRGLERNTGTFALRTLLAWLVAWPVAMLFRGIFVDKGVPPWTFALITLISNTILLQAWRVPFSLFFKRR